MAIRQMIRIRKIRRKRFHSDSTSSERAAAEMATGAIKALGADFSVAVTGIAGPDGGSEKKPVGLVYIACADKKGNVTAAKNLFSGDRKSVRDKTTETALQMLADFVG